MSQDGAVGGHMGDMEEENGQTRDDETEEDTLPGTPRRQPLPDLRAGPPDVRARPLLGDNLGDHLKLPRLINQAEKKGKKEENEFTQSMVEYLETYTS